MIFFFSPPAIQELIIRSLSLHPCSTSSVLIIPIYLLVFWPFPRTRFRDEWRAEVKEKDLLSPSHPFTDYTNHPSFASFSCSLNSSMRRWMMTSSGHNPVEWPCKWWSMPMVWEGLLQYKSEKVFTLPWTNQRAMVNHVPFPRDSEYRFFEQPSWMRFQFIRAGQGTGFECRKQS